MTSWNFHAYLYDGVVIEGILKGEIFQYFSLYWWGKFQISFILSSFGVCSHFSAVRLSSCKRKRIFFSPKKINFPSSLSVFLWKKLERRRLLKNNKDFNSVLYLSQLKNGFFWQKIRRTIVCVSARDLNLSKEIYQNINCEFS